MSMKLQKADPVEETPGTGLRKTVQVETFAANVAKAAAELQRAATAPAKSFVKPKDETAKPPVLSLKRLADAEFIRKDYRAAIEF